MITYRAMLDVPRELVAHLAHLLRTERRQVGTRKGARALTCWRQALMVLAWFRKGEDKTTLGAGFGISRATTYRYLAEGIRILAAQAPDLHQALTQMADQGWSHVILDGKLFACDRLAQTTTNANGDTIHTWYSGKHHKFGANIQAVFRPDGLPIWTSQALPGRLHDVTCAHLHDLPAALCWAASQLHLPTLADSAYENAGQGIHTPIRPPNLNTRLSIDNRTYNALLRATRAIGERGFALLTGRWRALRHFTASPSHIGAYVKAALVLTLFEHRYLVDSC